MALTRLATPSLRPRLGIGVAKERISGVLVARSRVVRTASVDAVDSEGLEAALAELIARLSAGRHIKPRVAVALGADAAQFRHLTRLPIVEHPRALSALVRANIGRFFLRNGSPLLVADVSMPAPGECWAAAFDEGALRAVVAACRRDGLRFALAVPTAAAVARLHKSRFPPVDEPHLDAVAAALWPNGQALAVYPRDVAHFERNTLPRWRLVVVASAFALALACAALAPTAATVRRGVAAAAQLAAINKAYSAALWTERELDATTSALGAFGEFSARRRSMTMLLADLTRVLPPGVSLVSIRIDQEGGSLTGLAPRGAALVSQLQEARSITAPSIVGSVSAETRGTERLERVTIRFRWRAPWLQRTPSQPAPAAR